MLNISEQDGRVQRHAPLTPGHTNDPEPARCAQPGHHNPCRQRRTCPECRAYNNWRAREYGREHRAGVTRRFTDIPRLLEHLAALEGAGMVIPDIARAAHMDPDVLWDLRNKTDGFVAPANAERLLAVPVPECRYKLIRNVRGDLTRRVDATGTRRRIRCAQHAGHAVVDQAAKLGWDQNTVYGWLGANNTTVSVDVADAVAALYPEMIAAPGSNAVAAGIAASKGWPQARHFCEANIDDPSYDPFRMVLNPHGVIRRLQALAYIGQGPAQVSARIGETPETVQVWTNGQPAPAYAQHLVAEAYEVLSGTPGPDQAAADRARHAGWASPLAWYEVDIDSHAASPLHDLPPGVRAATFVLTTMVLDALDGRAKAADLVHGEKVIVVTLLHRRGWSDRQIAAWLRWNPDDDVDKGFAAVCAFRLREEITGYGPRLPGSSNGDIIVPSAA